MLTFMTDISQIYIIDYADKVVICINVHVCVFTSIHPSHFINKIKFKMA